jgi:hypothetical protein
VMDLTQYTESELLGFVRDILLRDGPVNEGGVVDDPRGVWSARRDLERMKTVAFVSYCIGFMCGAGAVLVCLVLVRGWK